MKRMNRYSLCWLVLLLVLFEGCEKDEPMGYIGRPGFYFNGNEFSYSFAEKSLENCRYRDVARYYYRQT